MCIQQPPNNSALKKNVSLISVSVKLVNTGHSMVIESQPSSVLLLAMGGCHSRIIMAPGAFWSSSRK